MRGAGDERALEWLRGVDLDVLKGDVEYRRDRQPREDAGDLVRVNVSAMIGLLSSGCCRFKRAAATATWLWARSVGVEKGVRMRERLRLGPPTLAWLARSLETRSLRNCGVVILAEAAAGFAPAGAEKVPSAEGCASSILRR